MTDGERGATDVFRLLADEIRVDILCAIATLASELLVWKASGPRR